MLLLVPRVVGAQELMVESNLVEEEYLARDAAITLRFSRPLDPSSERVAVFLGDTDVTDLFESTASGMRYVPRLIPLPSGESELVVHLVRNKDEWREIVRIPLRVVGRLGFQNSTWNPGLDVAMKGRLAAGQKPDAELPIDQVDQDYSGQFILQSSHARGGLAITSETKFLGSSEQQAALRFGEKGSDAPRIDLSSYSVQYRHGDAALSLGHVGFGQQRHLINGFNSRGTLIAYAPGERVALSLAATNGTNVVGWDNLLGLDEPDHRVLSGALGIEALERPGALRLDFTWLGASVLPRSGFNQGDLTDAEESNGLGLTLRAASAGNRLRLEAGLARSSYDNPADPTLAQGDALVPVMEETKTARFLETSIGLLNNVALSRTRTATLELAIRHERIDPLYKSIGAYVSPDNQQNVAELRGTIAGMNIQAHHARSEDNLDEIASILKTRTRRSAGNVWVPLADVLGVGGRGVTWIPQARYSYDRTHQFGDGLPTDGGFSASHVPDQVSVNQSANLDWRWSKVTFGYRINHSEQDNRQEGRQNADLQNLANAFSLGVRPHQRVSLDAQLDLERRESEERDEVDNTRRWSVRTSLNVLSASQLTASWSVTHNEDAARTRERDDTSVDLQWSSAVPYLGRFKGQYFLRFGRSSSGSLDRQQNLDAERSNWTLDSGLNFTFF